MLDADEEAPRELVINRMNRSSLAAWLPEALALVFFCLFVAFLLSIPTGLIGGLILRAFFSSFRGGSDFWAFGPQGSGLILLGWLGLALWFVGRRRYAQMTSVRLIGDRIHVNHRVRDGWQVFPERFDLPLTEIGRVLFLAPSTITFSLGLEREVISAPVSRLIAGDLYERVLEHLQEHAPKHLYSLHAAGDQGYSRAWTLNELEADVARRFDLDVDLSGDYRIADGERHWHYSSHQGVLDGPDHVPLLRRYRELFEFRTGLYLCCIERDPEAKRRILIEFGTGDVVVVDRGQWVVEGAVTGRIGAKNVELDREVPLVMALVIAVVTVDPRIT